VCEVVCCLVGLILVAEVLLVVLLASISASVVILDFLTWFRGSIASQ
jgi:hypothetical protein